MKYQHEIYALILIKDEMEIVSVTLREGQDFWSDIEEELGDFYFLEVLGSDPS